MSAAAEARPADRLRPGLAARLLGWAGVACPAGILLLALLFLGWRFWTGIFFLSFEDEAVHLLGAKMLNEGGVLYRTFVDSHGPVIFLLTQVYGALFGWAAPNGARVIPVLLAILAGAAVAASPGLPGWRARCWGVSLFAGLLATVWLLQGLFMLSYYPVAGALAGIALAAFAAGAWSGAEVPAGLSFAAGAALALLVGSAYSYAPSAVLIAAGGGWAALREGQWRALRALAAGAVAGGLLVLLHLLWFGDLRGYLAFHVAESQVDYARYIGFSLRVFGRSLIPSLRPDDIVQSLAVVCTAASFAGFLALDVAQPAGRRRHAGGIALGVLGVLLLNARGMSIFQDGSFVIAAIVLLAIAVARLLARLRWQAEILGSACVALLIVAFHAAARPALYTPFGFDRAKMAGFPRWPLPSPADAPVFARVRALVGPGERILALTYQPSFYLHAGRDPMDGFYTYFPWDADYAKSPWFGMQRDLCTTLTAVPPPLIVFDQSPLWGHKPEDYMPCLFAALQRNYVRDSAIDTGAEQIYVRRGWPVRAGEEKRP
jgi:hypothetical protein